MVEPSQPVHRHAREVGYIWVEALLQRRRLSVGGSERGALSTQPRSVERAAMPKQELDIWKIFAGVDGGVASHPSPATRRHFCWCEHEHPFQKSSSKQAEP